MDNIRIIGSNEVCGVMSDAALKPSDTALRSMREGDNAAVASIIRAVQKEYGCVGEGYSSSDPDLDSLYQTFSSPRSAFFVVEEQGEVVGCAGIAPLKGSAAEIGEMQKYYILAQHRGAGHGTVLLDACLSAAKEFGFKKCYVETVARMEKAISIYERAGFKTLAGALGKTGHVCEYWAIKEL